MGGLVEVKMMLLWFAIIFFMTFMVVVIMTIMVVVVTFFIIMAMVCMWVRLNRHHLDRQSVRNQICEDPLTLAALADLLISTSWWSKPCSCSSPVARTTTQSRQTCVNLSFMLGVCLCVVYLIY